MTTIVQVEFRENLLSVRDEILQSLGHPVVSALGSRAARNLTHESVGVVLIGHGAPWEERCELAAHFRKTLPGVPIAASLRQRDKDAIEADYNLREIIRLRGCDWRLQASGHGRVQQPLDQLLERNCPFGRAHLSTSLPPAAAFVPASADFGSFVGNTRIVLPKTSTVAASGASLAQCEAKVFAI